MKSALVIIGDISSYCKGARVVYCSNELSSGKKGINSYVAPHMELDLSPIF